MTRDVGNFVHDLVEMAKAMEQLPLVREELEAAKHDVCVGLDRIQILELRLLDRANEIDALNAKVRSLEVERDDAQFQALEEQERTSAFKRFVENVFGTAGNLLKASQPAVEPTPIPPMPTLPADWRYSDTRYNNIEGRWEFYNRDAWWPFPTPEQVDALSVAKEDHIDAPSPTLNPYHTDPVPSLEGTPMPQPSADATMGQSVQDPTASTDLGQSQSVAAQPAEKPETVSSVTDVDATVGESAADPTAASSMEAPFANSASSETMASVSSPSEGVSVPVDPTPATESSSENASPDSKFSEAMRREAQALTTPARPKEEWPF